MLTNNGEAVTEWDEFLRADALSAFMVLLVAVVSLATSLYAVRYFRRDLADAAVTERRVREFYVLTPLFATGMLLVVLANNLGVMWIAVEATALSSVLLVALYNRKTSLEAAWKYVMLGGLGLVLALVGTIFTYAAAIGETGSHELPSFNWSRLLAMAPQFDPLLTQKNLKRMLAYSSLEHVGLICVAVGMNAPLTVFGALLHMGYHALTKPVLFFAAGNIHQQFHTLDFRRIGSGLVHTMPVTALLLGLAAIAVSGLPPSGLFVSEMTVVIGGFTSEHAWASVLVLIALIVVFCGVLNKLATLLLGPVRVGPAGESVSAGNVAAMSLPLATLLIFTAWLPSSLRQLMEQAAGIIRGMP
ncbi:MAG: hypothetical protein HY300_08210 [Verrucomicrobia bacterium]|nr:hypothetical protein [Verrucomicrobiota bacterium]